MTTNRNSKRREHRLDVPALCVSPVLLYPFPLVLSTRQTPTVLPRSRKTPVSPGAGHGRRRSILCHGYKIHFHYMRLGVQRGNTYLYVLCCNALTVTDRTCIAWGITSEQALYRLFRLFQRSKSAYGAAHPSKITTASLSFGLVLGRPFGWKSITHWHPKKADCLPFPFGALFTSIKSSWSGGCRSSCFYVYQFWLKPFSHTP